MLANGFLQAACVHRWGIFRQGLNFYPLCTATQFIGTKCTFLLRLDKSLSNKAGGTFNISLNSPSLPYPPAKAGLGGEG